MSVVDSDSWIFVNYAPGAFGSFLTKVLESSPDVHGAKTTDIFNQCNASHNDITHWIKYFHDGDELTSWAVLSYEEQQQYILNNINTTLISTTNLKRVHRLTIPKYNYLFKQHFSCAKFIKITIDPVDIDFIADMMCKKTFYEWITFKILYPLKKIMLNIEDNKKQQYYKKVCQKHITDILDNSIEADTFNFPVRAFFSLEQFNIEIDKLTSWLNIQPGNCQDLYNKFFLHHNKFKQL